MLYQTILKLKFAIAKAELDIKYVLTRFTRVEIATTHCRNYGGHTFGLGGYLEIRPLLMTKAEPFT